MPRTTPRDLLSPDAAPAARTWDEADLTLQLYFRRAVYKAVIGAPPRCDGEPVSADDAGDAANPIPARSESAGATLTACTQARADTPLELGRGADFVSLRSALLSPGDELRAALELDPPAEATGLLLVQGVWFSCESEHAPQRALPCGYELRTWEAIGSYRPLDPQGYVTRRIGRDGRIRVTAEGALYWNAGCPIAGRRPAGLLPAPVGPRPSSALARYFARSAALEAASVPAFEALEAELRALGAPPLLLDKVREAIADEREHTARVGQLAQRFGARAERPEVEPRPLRDRFALALDNVVEGCVRESFGALLATFQAAHARNPHVRDTLAPIARDETRHAALAFQIQAWLEASLDADERRALACAREAALEALRQELAVPVNADLRELAGMPGAAQRQVLLAELRGLWPARETARA